MTDLLGMSVVPFAISNYISICRFLAKKKSSDDATKDSGRSGKSGDSKSRRGLLKKLGMSKRKSKKAADAREETHAEEPHIEEKPEDSPALVAEEDAPSTAEEQTQQQDNEEPTTETKDAPAGDEQSNESMDTPEEEPAASKEEEKGVPEEREEEEPKEEKPAEPEESTPAPVEAEAREMPEPTPASPPSTQNLGFLCGCI